MLPSKPFPQCLRRGIGPRVGLLSLLMLASPTWAIDIPVDILGDPAPNGCTVGHCSLREAVILANSVAGPDRILLPGNWGQSDLSVGSGGCGHHQRADWGHVCGITGFDEWRPTARAMTRTLAAVAASKSGYYFQ